MFLRGRGIGASSLTLASGSAAPTGQRALCFVQNVLQRRQAGGPRSMNSSIDAGSGTPACRADLLDVDDQIVGDGAETRRRLDVGAIGHKTHSTFS